MDKLSNKIHVPSTLPISAQQDTIMQALQENRVIVVAGETGSGKTTQLPKMCLAAGLGQKRLIGCTQPRRLAATSVAARVREELGAEGAGLVGYKIRFQDRTSRATRIKFMTDGILLAEAQGDPLLRAYEAIIVDEAHERSLNIDFLLGILKRLLARRADLKVIVTSATIDTAKFSRHFGEAPVIEVSGRTYPVEVRYLPSEEEPDEEVSSVDRAVAAVLDLKRRERSGDVLVFMPTERDIREAADSLAEAWKGSEGGAWSREPLILPLFGRLSGADQNRIFAPHAGQKIVIATNVAETSVTVPGIRYVVDTGLARIAAYNVRARTTKLPVKPVSRASADQRRGRCGRVGPGVCLRLFSEEDYNNRPEYTLPEILRSNLAEVILRMISLRLGDPAEFPFIDPPSSRAIRDGYSLLRELGAIDAADRLTERGRIMARLPLDPRISRMIVEARDRNCLTEVTVIAAALSIQDPRVRPAEKEAEADAVHARFQDKGSDFFSYLNLWQTVRSTMEQVKSQSRLRKFCKTHFLAYQRLREWLDVHEQIWAVLEEENGPARDGRRRPAFLANVLPAPADAVHQALLSGNLRHIGLKKAKNLYQGAGGKEMMVFPGSGLYNTAGQWLMAAELVETSNLYARTVAAIKPEWLEPLAGDLCRYSHSSPHWEKSRGQVVALEKVTLFGLVIAANRRVNFGRIAPAEARRIFIQSALLEGEVRGRYPFLDRNRELVARLEGLEDRVRQRDILVDDQTLFQFYDERLPADVHDEAGLTRLLRRGGGDSLLMREEDLLRRAPGAEQLGQFPEQLALGEFSVPLSYKFQPGGEEDGVGVTLPVSLLSRVAPETFEWLVPGLLPEKIVFLLKGLPKNLRKRLVPIPQTAETLLRELVPGQGSLYGQLERLIAERYGIEVHRSHWPLADLPPHLKMRFSLTDHQGKVLAASRELADLAQVRPPAAGGGLHPALKKKWERQGIATWDFAGLPERITIEGENGQFNGFAFPGLAVEGTDTVDIRLFATEAESRQATREGLLVLYRNVFPKPFKAARKDFALEQTDWALYEGIGGHEEVNRRLLAAILHHIFETGEGRIPDQERFERKVAEIRADG
ncbi:MAG: ATP-dependent RNA helicase HrpA, partial [Desulfobacteraceae bacterium]|nr:ATP-dependent RNA helicase HrpA [Desulfobacteraceae bacterium]